MYAFWDEFSSILGGFWDHFGSQKAFKNRVKFWIRFWKVPGGGETSFFGPPGGMRGPVGEDLGGVPEPCGGVSHALPEGAADRFAHSAGPRSFVSKEPCVNAYCCSCFFLKSESCC